MKSMVTGATGFIGNRLVNELLNLGYEVNILVRSLKLANELYGNRVSFFEGDILNKDAINQTISGCDVVFHLAAFANIWSSDKTLAYKTNVLGTQNILESALQGKVKKVIYTSSAGVFPPSENGEEIDEKSSLPEKYLTDYETTKAQAEQLCMEYCKKGLDVVIVNPPRVYGPGLLNKSNSVTILIKKYINGNWHLIPGTGNSVGNYVFIDDVVKGHILASRKGIAGEKYILGGINVSFNKFFKVLSEVSGKKYHLFHLAFGVVIFFAKVELLLAEIIGKKPMVTPPWAIRYNQNRPVSSQKAIKELGYAITPLYEGFQKTIEWLNAQKQ